MDFRSKVNPTHFTAKAAAFMLAANNDRDALEFIGGAGLTRDYSSAIDEVLQKTVSKEDYDALTNGIALFTESEYKGISRILKEEGYKNFLDVACGYTPRSVYCDKEGVEYVGMDVPLVAEELTAFAKKRFPDRKRPTYVGGDATNAASLMAAANLLEGEIMISSEGLLPYLTFNELEQFVAGIREVLKIHSGAWYTSDFDFKHDAFAMFALSGKEAKDSYMNLKNRLRKESEVSLNELHLQSADEIHSFLNKHGLKAERIPFYAKEEDIQSLNVFTDELQNRAKELLKETCYWKITLNDSSTVEEKNEGAKEVANLKIYYSVNGNELLINLSGRVDTISAPALLEIVDAAGDDLSCLTINADHLEYMSSAGLRVLLIAVKKFGEVKMIHTSDEVKDILSVTGFDSMITLE